MGISSDFLWLVKYRFVTFWELYLGLDPEFLHFNSITYAGGPCSVLSYKITLHEPSKMGNELNLKNELN